MAVFTRGVVPACSKGHKCMFGLPSEHFAAFDLKSQPGALSAPVCNGLAVQARLLDGKRGCNQIVSQAQYICAVP